MLNLEVAQEWSARVSGEDWQAGVCSMLERRRAKQEQMHEPKACRSERCIRHRQADHGRNNEGRRRAWFKIGRSTSWSCGSEHTMEAVCKRDSARFDGFARGVSARSLSNRTSQAILHIAEARAMVLRSSKIPINK
ncbi:hypothetical protein M5K25_009973 [Dendrobium thyrsiflorum]|uniref:Uncharacterized protein n=1 Tax=Dendrobium thyrsiflorum TaxID=117978 RepID=A0ABD0V737_DENTH